MATNSLLLAYCVTAERAYLERLEHTLVQQDILDRMVEEGNLAADRVLFADTPPEHLPERIRYAFENTLVTAPPYVIADGRKHFCLAKFRNASIDYALHKGYEWLMLCDCDTVFFPGRFHEPETRYGIPDVYWQQSKNETIGESLELIRAMQPEIFSKGNSWFILHRDIMNRLRFNERIYGYGCEDVEFDIRANACGFNLASVGIVVVHMYHSDAERAIDPRIFARNEAIVQTTKALLRQGHDPSALPVVDVEFGKHPHWSSAIAFIPSKERVYLCSNKSWGNYFSENDGTLVIEWDDYPNEEFELVDGSFSFVRQRQNTNLERRRASYCQGSTSSKESSSHRQVKGNLITNSVDPLLCVVHIPKTAGTAIGVTLRMILGSDKVYWIGQDRPVDHWEKADGTEFGEYLVIGGHYEASAFEKIQRPKIFLAIIRDPVQRAVSLFHFIKSGPDVHHPLRAELQELNLIDAVNLSQRFRAELENRQCALIGDIPTYTAAFQSIRERKWFIDGYEHIDELFARVCTNMRWPSVPLMRENTASDARYFEQYYANDVGTILNKITQEDAALYRLFARNDQ